MFCVVGLGNIGSNYLTCRHNAGFMALDYLSEKLQASFCEYLPSALIAETNVDEKKILLVKPLTSINRSGECIKELISSFDFPLQNIIILNDDTDLPLGEIRIRHCGSAGTHNGLRSIVKCLESEDFPRIRIGIGKPRENEKIIEYVLGTPSREEREKLDFAFEECLEAVLLIVKGQIDIAQNFYNVKGRTRRKIRPKIKVL